MRDIVLNNFWWKVTALLLAILAWIGFQRPDKRWNVVPVTYRASYVRYLLRHEVTIIKAANDTNEFKVTPAEVDISLSGDQKFLENLRGTEVRASVDVVNFSAKSNSLPLKVAFPPGGNIKLETVVPDRVQVELLKE
jgi:hypothetical protein